MKYATLEITKSYIKISGTSEYVMMDWEHPIMKKHAQIVCKNGGDILEIGFGLGISANYIQEHNINTHTIVEIHPVIASMAREWAKDKPNVTILEGDWFELQDEICKKKYDGIFYDAHNDMHVLEFPKLIVERCIKPKGIFTFLSFWGIDIFNYGDKFKKEKVIVNPDPNNYYNNKELYCVWVEF